MKSLWKSGRLGEVRKRERKISFGSRLSSSWLIVSIRAFGLRRSIVEKQSKWWKGEKHIYIYMKNDERKKYRSALQRANMLIKIFHDNDFPRSNFHFGNIPKDRESVRSRKRDAKERVLRAVTVTHHSSKSFTQFPRSHYSKLDIGVCNNHAEMKSLMKLKQIIFQGFCLVTFVISMRMINTLFA